MSPRQTPERTRQKDNKWESILSENNTATFSNWAFLKRFDNFTAYYFYYFYLYAFSNMYLFTYAIHFTLIHL